MSTKQIAVEKIKCACGCDELIDRIDRWHTERFYKNGHNARRQNNSNWIGGKIKDTNGYVKVICNPHPRAHSDGYVFEHILVFEQYHRCCVLKWGNIHHINHNKSDNRPENLEDMTRQQHSRLHMMGNKYAKRVST
jgi:hypothetical protein